MDNQKPTETSAVDERIADVLRDPDLARRLSAAARPTIAAGFHSGISAERLLERLRQ